MASTSNGDDSSISALKLDELKGLLWGKDIKCDVFQRWTQGFVFSEDESTALVQQEGGPCAVIAPVQSFLLKNILFSNSHKKEDWRRIGEEEQGEFLVRAFVDLFLQVKSGDEYMLLHLSSNCELEGKDSDPNDDDGESSPKKRKLSHEQFHGSLRCRKCENTDDLRKLLKDYIDTFYGRYGVLLLLYSVILTKGIEHIKNEVEDLSEPLIDGIHGHGSTSSVNDKSFDYFFNKHFISLDPKHDSSQSLINLLLTGKAVSNVWDNDKEVSGLKLQGITKQSTIGFLTQLEHLRYCEVGWYFKNPTYPIWLLGSETHLTVLFSTEENIVTHESPESAARRVFGSYDPDNNGFIQSEKLADLLQTLDLVYEPPEYVKIMLEKLDPEQLGIITLNAFMEEFFPNHNSHNVSQTFNLIHYNGLKRSCPNNKVGYHEGTASIMDMPELQFITDTSAIKTCLMTKWPTIELKWKNDSIPSLN